MTRYLTREEKATLIISLQCRRNHIETGDVAMSEESAKRCGEKVEPLSIDQMKLIGLQGDLIFKIIQNEIIVCEEK